MNAATPVFTGLLLIAITSICKSTVCALNLVTLAVAFLSLTAHAEVSLTVRLAGGVCRQYKQWKTTKQLPAPLKTKSAQVQTASIKGCKVLQKTACADSSGEFPYVSTFSCAKCLNMRNIFQIVSHSRVLAAPAVTPVLS